MVGIDLSGKYSPPFASCLIVIALRSCFSKNWHQSQRVYLASKFTRNKCSWLEWEKRKNKKSLGSRNLMAKNTSYEDVNGGLSVPKGSILITGKKKKIVDDYEGWRMRGS